MGVPKFYRWISERYPCLSEVVKDYQIPEFDNLYLDMNGIIHVCSHPEDDNPHFRITEEKIFQDIFHYIEVLFRMIKPRKVFFMAVDGVAPRAKMNQQRGRRFRSAREAEMLVRKALEKGETLPTEARFDSNCITPGTEFMSKLQEQLKYFVVKKITSDKLWQGPKVYLSGHETPGEGEHKVMDFIRYQKSQPDYDPNTRHCLYGLDADLMMLGLSSHEPHFSLLREEVRFGGKNSQKQKRSTAPEETTFHLLHLTLFREYLDFEFAELKDKLPFRYDLERIIDDWILMGFLVGNDFIPHLPNMHIHHDALPTLWKNYKQVLPTLDGYLHDGGTLNLPRFEKFMTKLSEVDMDAFADKFSDLKWLEAKSESKAAKDEANIRQRASVSSNDVGIPTANEFFALRNITDDGEEEDLRAEMGAMTLEDFEDIEDDFMAEENAMLEKEFRSHKDAYYLNKMSLTSSREVLQNQAESYIRAIQWILHYYFNGVPSWSWYYPYHYAPYLSDVRNFADMKMDFDISKPFLPFQQLMAVLPAASKNIMPKPLQKLMVDESSPVIDFYPADFELDLNGKLQEWEAVVLIPFIQEERLLNAMAPLEDKLTDEEKARNKHGPHTLFYFDTVCQGTYHSSMIDKYPESTVYNHHARICTVDKDLFRIPQDKIYKGLCEAVSLEVYYPGFPTLKHLPHTARLSKAGVKVFQMNSRGENMMLTLTNTVEQDTEQVAMEYLGRSIYVSWPHMIEARVVAVADGTFKYSLLDNNTREHQDRKDIQRHHMNQDDSRTWAKQVTTIEDMYHDRKGVEIGETNILVFATPMTGRKYVYNTSITLEKQWSSTPVAYALQATAKDIAVKDPVYRQYKTLEELFTPKTWVFMLGQPHYGCMGEILDVDPSNEGRIRVNFVKPYEPNLAPLLRQNEYADKYLPGYIVAQKVGMSGFLVSRFTGVLYISKGSKAHPPARDTNRTNVGLNLKYNKTNMEVPGFTRKSEVDNQWLYSHRVLQILLEYTEKFPVLFDYISNCQDENFYEDDIFGEDSSDKVKELREYLKSLPSAEVAPAEQGTRIVHEEVVEAIQREVDKALSSNRSRKRIKMQVKPHLLYRSLHAQANSLPDPTTTYHLFDRVVNVREGYSVPLGQRGSVIGIRAAAKEQDVLYEVLFDEEFQGGFRIRCKANKAYRMPATALINLTHGERKEEAKNSFKPTAVVKPQQGKMDTFKPSWMQGKTGGGEWNQQQYPPQSAPQGHPRGQQIQQSARATHSSGHQGHPQLMFDRSNQQFQSGNQQVRGTYQQQWRGGNGGGPNTMHGHGYPGGYGNGHQGYYSNNKHMGGTAMAGCNSSGQQSSGRQTYHQMQQQQQHPSFNQYGRREEKTGFSGYPRHGEYSREATNYGASYTQPQEVEESADQYENVWKQLQGATPQTWHDKGSSGGDNRNPAQKHSRKPPQSNQRHQQQSNQRQHTGPSLNDAAKALKQSHFSTTSKGASNTKTATRRSPSDHNKSAADVSSSQSSQQPQPQSSQPVDINQLFNQKTEAASDKEDFNRLMAALHPKAKSNTLEQPQEATQAKSAAQEGTEALQQLLRVPSSVEPSSSDQPSSGKPSYGKQVSVQDLFQGAKSSATNRNQKDKHGTAQKGRPTKPNPVGALLDYCKSKDMLAPRYEYKYGKDNKMCCVVTMPDGEQFKGSYAKERQTAMDSAANSALNNLGLSGCSNVPGIFLGQKKSEEPADANFAMSPNSAFKAVRGTGPMGMEFSFTGTSSRHGNPFPNPSSKPQFPAPQQVQLHTRQGQSDQYYHANTEPQRHQGHHSQQQHHHHQQHKNYHGQGHSAHNNSGSYDQEHRGHGTRGFDRHENDQDRSKDVPERGRKDSERSKDNPFVPLQVFKKQKTPVKSDSREARHPAGAMNPHEASVASTQVGDAELEMPDASGATAAASTASNSTKQRDHTRKGKGSSQTQKETGTKSGSKSQPKRPKSRIAAKFT